MTVCVCDCVCVSDFVCVCDCVCVCVCVCEGGIQKMSFVIFSFMCFKKNKKHQCFWFWSLGSSDGGCKKETGSDGRVVDLRQNITIRQKSDWQFSSR